MAIGQASLRHLRKMDVTSSYDGAGYMPKFTWIPFLGLDLDKSMALWPLGEHPWLACYGWDHSWLRAYAMC